MARAASDLDTGNILFETSNSDLPVGTFTEANEIPGDTYTLTLGGSGSGSFSLDPSSGVLSTGSSAVAGLASYALSVQVNDTTAGTTFLQPFDVVVGSSSGDTMTLTGAGSLGLTPSTPTFIYGLNGNDTLNATGMTGQIWMAGGAGSDTMTGSTSGANTYLYASVNDSLPGAGNFDLITNFNVTLDRIDLRGIGGATLTYRAAQLSGSTLTADTIAWQQSGGNTYVNINTSSGNETLSGVNMLIELSGNKALTSTDVLHN